jgi:hypothetical protein
VHNVSRARDAQPGCINVFYHEASGYRRPRRTLRSSDCQRAPRNLSAHAVALCSSCANHVPHCTAQALRAQAAVYARRPRRTLRSHDRQRASRKLSVHAVALCASFPPTILPRCSAPAASVQSPYLTHSGCNPMVSGWAWYATRTASAAAVSTATKTMHSPVHRRLRQALRRHRCTARPLDRFSHGRRDRDVH